MVSWALQFSYAHRLWFGQFLGFLNNYDLDLPKLCTLEKVRAPGRSWSSWEYRAQDAMRGGVLGLHPKSGQVGTHLIYHLASSGNPSVSAWLSLICLLKILRTRYTWLLLQWIGEWTPAFPALPTPLWYCVRRIFAWPGSPCPVPTQSVIWSTGLPGPNGPFLSSAAQLPSGMTEKEAGELVAGQRSSTQAPSPAVFVIFPVWMSTLLVLFLC